MSAGVAQRVKKGIRWTDRILWRNYLGVLGIISTIVTLLSFFMTADALRSYKWIAAVLFIAMLLATFLIMWFRANRRQQVYLRINHTAVHVSIGNIFSLLAKKPSERNDEICVIGVNDYYDLIVDNRIIAENSLHGQYIKTITADGKLEQLNEAIEKDPRLNHSGNYEPVPSRSIGRKTRYKIGSVVEFESYVLTAFTKFDDHNKAYLSAEEYVDFWMEFWQNIDEIYASRTIHIPLMGAGITRFRNGKPSKQELLETMLWTMKMSGFHNTSPGRQVNFVIYPGDAPEIDFYHIQHNPNFQ